MRRLLFPVALVAVTLALGLLAVPAGYLDRSRRWCRYVAPAWCRAMLAAAGVRVEVEGWDRVPRDGRCVFVANHQSNLDIVVLGSVLPHEVLWLAKRELFRIPVFGTTMRAVGYLPVDRGRRDEARASIDAAARAVREGSPVILFPEGTRSRDGRLLPFKLGFVHLAATAGAPVVPLVLRGTAELWPKGSRVPRSGVVRVRALDPVRIEGIDTPEERRAHAEALRARMARALGAP